MLTTSLDELCFGEKEAAGCNWVTLTRKSIRLSNGTWANSSLAHSQNPGRAGFLGWSLCLSSPHTAAGCCNTARSGRRCNTLKSPPMPCGWGKGMQQHVYSQRNFAGFSQPACPHIQLRRHRSALSPSPCSASRRWAADSWLWSDSFCSRCPQVPPQLKWWSATSPESAHMQSWWDSREAVEVISTQSLIWLPSRKLKSAPPPSAFTCFTCSFPKHDSYRFVHVCVYCVN